MSNLGVNVNFDDRSLNDNDASYLMTGDQTKLSNYIQIMNSPEDVHMLQVGKKGRLNREIYDADGDGIEDNIRFNHDDLDEFYIPAVFGVAEDLFNTHNGEMPGHVQKDFDDTQTEPKDTYSIVNRPWATK